MPYTVELEQDEKLIGQYVLQVGKRPFAFAVTTLAFFLPPESDDCRTAVFSVVDGSSRIKG